MWKRDYRDIAAGGFFLACGLAASIYAMTHYAMGTFRSIGPGMFPACVGLVTAAFGLAILIPALGRAGVRPSAEPAVALPILGSVAAFCIVVPLFGLVPATFALTLVAGLAETRFRLLAPLVLAAVLSVLTWAVFVAGLGVPLRAFRWPW
jgi:hypothetical protein